MKRSLWIINETQQQQKGLLAVALLSPSRGGGAVFDTDERINHDAWQWGAIRRIGWFGS